MTAGWTRPNRRRFLTGAAAAGLIGIGTAAAQEKPEPGDIVLAWYKLILELVRHTPTCSPPVASRALSYLGIAAFEAVASGSAGLRSLSGQLNGLPKTPGRMPGAVYGEAMIMHAALSRTASDLFSHTGPTGQRAILALEKKLGGAAAAGLPDETVRRSRSYGRALADCIIQWSQGDGGAIVENLGFPLDYKLTKGPAHWLPTSTIALQQKPLLPQWGNNRTFAMPSGAACGLPPPPAYSEDKSSQFYGEASEVCETVRNLSAEQRAIARFWSDDPMLSPTPPGHWISIALQLFEREASSLEQRVDILARLGIAMTDAFIACWKVKYEYDLLRPVTYIRRVIDPKWEPLLITPPFPEYPSGHSAQSSAAATVLEAVFGGNFAFEDATHARDGLSPRSFPSFWAATEEAAISRLYGGIHFRAAIERGLEQGRCVGAFANALQTRS